MGAILDDIKQSFKQGSNLTKVIYINLVVFILVNLVSSFAFIMKSKGYSIVEWMAVPAYLPQLITKPWTVITYMFLHEGFIHILFNMLWLYFGGRIFEDLLGQRRFISTYILGGISGAFVFILAYNIFPAFQEVLAQSRALGASASVLAIIVAIATKAPNFAVRLIFLGNVKLKYIAIFSVVLNLISLQDGNAGGHLAHIGGAAFGFLYIKQLNRGLDWSLGFFQFINAFKSIFTFSKSQNVKVVHRNRGSKKPAGNSSRSHQEAVDIILDKISRSGYDSLTKEEKNTLFRASQNS